MGTADCCCSASLVADVVVVGEVIVVVEAVLFTALFSSVWMFLSRTGKVRRCCCFCSSLLDSPGVWLSWLARSRRVWVRAGPVVVGPWWS